MITQYEIGELLQKEIPQLEIKQKPSSLSSQIYTLMNAFSDYIERAVEAHDFKVARRCFMIAEEMFKQGDRIVRLVIENILVYNFDNFLSTNKTQRIVIRTLIPNTLYNLYLKQAMQTGC